MARRKYIPNEVQYRVRDGYLRVLFLAIFQDKHKLNVYSYRGTHRQTMYCSGDREAQKVAWSEFSDHAEKLQAYLTRATRKYIAERITEVK